MRRTTLIILFFTTLFSNVSNASLPNEQWACPFDGTLEPRHSNSFASCNDENGLPLKVQNAVLTDCFPEVVYSWGSKEYVEAVINGLNELNDWRVPVSQILRGAGATLSTALTPASTMIYGQLPLRIKLKKGIKYEVRSMFDSWTNCDGLDPKKNKSDTVFVLNKPLMGTGLTYEVAICHFGVIDSISTGSQQHYDETVRDLALLSEGSHETYSYIQAGINGIIEKMLAFNFDGKPFLYKVKTKGSILNRKIVGIVAQEIQILDGEPTTVEAIQNHINYFYSYVISVGIKFASNPEKNGAKFDDHINVNRPLAFH